MAGFLEALRTQRWDDHRYYHHSRINQSLHLVSAISFLCAYVLRLHGSGRGGADRLAGRDDHPADRPLLLRAARTTTTVNQATHEYKEEIKVGYNLQRKVVLMAIWALSPLPLYFDPTLFGLFEPHADASDFMRHVALIWLVVGLGGLLFRTVQLFFLQGRADRPGLGDQDPHRPVPRHQALPQGAAAICCAAS